MEYLSAALAKSGPLDIPSEKISIFNFNPWKDTCFENSLVVL